MINWRMHHPIIDLIGYCIVLAWAILVGMTIGVIFEDEFPQKSQPIPVWYRLPTKDNEPSPDMFEGMA
jgi:hypothetical protein